MISYLISCVSGLQHHKILYIVIELLFIIRGEVINIAIAKPLSTHRAGACVEFIHSVAVITFYSEGLKKKKKKMPSFLFHLQYWKHILLRCRVEGFIVFHSALSLLNNKPG